MKRRNSPENQNFPNRKKYQQHMPTPNEGPMAELEYVNYVKLSPGKS